MNTPTANTSSVQFDNAPGTYLLSFIARAQECLWLLAVFLVPIMFLGRDYSVSEAAISYLEVPKVALLRTLAGLMSLLWISEWAIKSRTFNNLSESDSTRENFLKFQPSRLISTTFNWLRVHPIRWFILAAALFFGSSFLSTALSGSFVTSMWGEIPGQDGYSAYTVASYGVLFGAIATHMRTYAQVQRLIASVVLMGFLVGLYSSFQHYDHDFLGLTETTGGGTSRVTAFMGNAIFSGAVLSMTVPLTIMAALLTLHEEDWVAHGVVSKLGQLRKQTVVTYIWALILAVQLLGLMFTFSRGPWVGAALAIAMFLGLLIVSFGLKTLVKTCLVLGLAGIFAVSFLHWNGNIAIIDVHRSLGLLLTLLALIGTFVTLYVIKHFVRGVISVSAVGVVVIILGIALLAPSAVLNQDGTDSVNIESDTGKTSGQVSERLSSIKTDVLGGFTGGRGSHWNASWDLINDRPWFEFDDLHFSWIRPVVGYGPDLFRYTFLLESPPDGPGLRPLEPDHAHNFFIHQTVELGFLGGFASLAIFFAAIGVAGQHVFQKRAIRNPLYRLLLFGLAAVIFGRLFEMMVGVARISDLTVLWVIFGLFASLVNVDKSDLATSDAVKTEQTHTTNRRSRRRSAKTQSSKNFNTGLLLRLSVLTISVGVIGIITWQQSINSVRASIAEGQAVKHFQNRDLENALRDLDKAIQLAPGIPIYHNNRANIFTLYQSQSESLTEPDCANQTQYSYEVCLGLESLKSNLEAVRQQPFDFRSRIAAANSAFNLQLDDSATESYRAASNIVPMSWTIRNNFAESLIKVGQFEESLREIEASLDITGDTSRSSHALYLKGKVQKDLGRLNHALLSLKHGLSLDADSNDSSASLSMIKDIFSEMGVTQDFQYFESVIATNPKDAVTYYIRSLAYLEQGDLQDASDDVEQAYALGLVSPEINATRGYLRYKLGDVAAGASELKKTAKAIPQDPLVNAYLGELYFTNKDVIPALHYLETANILDSTYGMPYLIQSKIYLLLGLVETAREILPALSEFEFSIPEHYIDRGKIHAFFGDYDSALSDINRSIQTKPDQADYYNVRAKVHASMGNLEFALDDFDLAIKLAPIEIEYLINRGVAFDIIGKKDESIADFKLATYIRQHPSGQPKAEIPKPDDRNLAHFDLHSDIPSVNSEDRQKLQLDHERQAFKDLQYYSKVSSGDPLYRSSIQYSGLINLSFGTWAAAASHFSRLISLSPSTPEAYKYRGDALLGLERNQEALKDYEQAIGLNPLASANLIGKANALAKIGDFGLARKTFEQAMELDPNSSDAFAFRALMEIRLGNYSEAVLDAGRAIEISSVNHFAYQTRANAHAELGETSLAVKDIDQAIVLAPINADYFYERGILRLERGEYELAVDDFDDAVLLKARYVNYDPRNANPYLGRARSYLKLGEPEKSVDDVLSAISVLNRTYIELTGGQGSTAKSHWEYYIPKLNLQYVEAYDLLNYARSETGDTNNVGIAPPPLPNLK